jgi:hypothetical protein
LLCYAWLRLSSAPHLDRVRAAVVPLRDPTGRMDRHLDFLGERDVSRAHLPVIDGLLRSVVHAMLDPNVPIQHDPASTHCRFCAV